MSNVISTISNDYRGPFTVSDNFEKFLDILKETFPEKYEEKYSKLINLIIDYSNISSKIQIMNSTNNLNSSFVESDNEEINKIKKDLMAKEVEALRLEELINSIPVDKPGYERLSLMQNLMILNKERMEIQKELSILSIKKHSKETDMISNNYTLSELEEKLQKIVEDIKETNEEIKSFNINGEDRLNNLKVYEKHINKLEELLHSYQSFNLLDNLLKERISYSYKLFFLESFRLRKNMYFIGEKVAEDIVEKNNNRELLDSNNQDISLVKTAVLAAGSWKIHDVVSYAFPHPGTSWTIEQDDNYKKVNAVAECFSTISNVMDKHVKNEVSLDDVKAAREKLYSLSSSPLMKTYNLKNHVTSIDSIAGDPANMLGEYERTLETKKEHTL